ncbi:MAG: PilT/PilU family type 4a pilus ATPase [Eggerthellaceae bacterium]|mgnify:CR=1 FL=1|jgi:twitching motility protein PilT|nr:PilT/PilU family type 4a pilus ATPase [Eggerthellaceae bacterium]MCH4221009.1 PilT/PilU family type 4a pilus ATPase [Eggerthellaceae bacterium]
MDVKTLLAQMMEQQVSDIFVIAGLPLTYAAGGQHVRLDTPAFTPDDTAHFVEDLYAIARRDSTPFIQSGNHDDDFSFSIAGMGRFRANIFRQRGSYSAVIRLIPFQLPDPEALHIPPQVMKLAELNKGLVLVTGPSGAGKTTTLACLIDRINHTRSGHIITMEDPIEYIHRHGTCIVTQREIPTDVATYPEALNSAMREDPDILLLGEMRSAETVSTAVSAAEMAQLIFSTLHTMGAASTIDRIIDTYPATQQHQARLQLSMTLQAIVSQQLIPTADNKGMIPAFEIMVCNSAIRTLIRDAKTHQIDSAIASGKAEGMQTMDQSLFNLCTAGLITQSAALQYSSHQSALEHRFAAGQDE